MSWRWPTESVEPRSFTLVATPSARERMNSPRPISSTACPTVALLLPGVPGVSEWNGVGIGFDEDWLVEEFEDGLGSRHGGLEDVEFLAEVLNRAEEALCKHCERRENAKSEPARENANSAGPKDQGDGGEAKKFDGRVEEGVSEDGVAPGEHIVAIALFEFIHGFAFAIEELHNAHAGNVFLEEGVDAGDRGADRAIGIAAEFAENHGDDEDAGKDSEGGERQAGVDLEKQAGHDHEEKEVVDHGDDAGGAEIVEGIDVGGDARGQAPDGI